MESYVHLGTILRPHGTDGRVLVELYQVCSIRPGTVVRIGYSPAFCREFIVESFSMSGRRAIVRLQGIRSRPDADRLREQGVFSLTSEFAATTQVPDDPTGWRIITTDGEMLGYATGIEENPAHPLLSIERSDGSRFLLPMVSHFIVGRDETAGVLVVDPPEGLLETAARKVTTRKRDR